MIFTRRCLIVLLMLAVQSIAQRSKSKLPRGTKTSHIDLDRQPRILQSKNTNNNNRKTPSATPSVQEQPTESPYPSPSPSETPTISPYPSGIGDTLPPTESPSTSSPSTSSPSVSPTISPSLSPTTSVPTITPSASPSITVPVGFMNLSFSLLAEGVTSEAVGQGLNTTVVGNLSEAVLHTLCEDTNFILLDEDNGDSCSEKRRHERLLQDNSFAKSQYIGETIVRPEESEIHVTDQTQGEFFFSRWTFEYPILQVGNDFANLSHNDALLAIQSIAQEALNLQISSGDFDAQSGQVGRTSVVDLEVNSWTEPYYTSLQPSPLHALRVTGIVLFIFSLTVTCFVTNLAKQRRIEREWDAEFKVRGKGGLVTEEGLDLMLQAGRNQSISQQDKGGVVRQGDYHDDDDDDDDNDSSGKLPLPACFRS